MGDMLMICAAFKQILYMFLFEDEDMQYIVVIQPPLHLLMRKRGTLRDEETIRGTEHL